MNADAPHGIPCPREQVWDEIAAGLIRGVEADNLLEHASWCSKCAALLRSSIAVFGPEHVVTIRPRRWRQYAGYAAAAAVLIAAVAGLWWKRDSPETMLSLLAKPQGEQRTFAMRIPGAPHRAYDPSRSADRKESPAAWLEARARVQRKLAADPDNAGWHAARGRLCLLELQNDCAISELRLASDMAGDPPPDLTVDLASAYYLRGRQNNSPTDLTLAVEYLSKVLARHPGHLTARFNRAVAEEALGLLSPAIEDYEAIAATDTDAGWKKEAADAAARLRAQKAAVFEQAPGEAESRHPETALEAALRTGLSSDPAELRRLAKRLEMQHGDAWLRRVLVMPLTPELRRAIAVLARMSVVRTNLVVGMYRELEREFDSMPPLPPPLEEWQRYERVYRATHDFRYACPERVTTEASPWFSVQLERESALCALRRHDVNAALEGSQRSEMRAAQYGFRVSAVRARGIQGGIEIRRGHYREALRLGRSGIAEILEFRLPAVRLQQFTSGIVLAAASLDRWHAARRAAKFSALIAQTVGLGSAAFNTLAYWAWLARRTGQLDEARAAYESALVLWNNFEGKAAGPDWKAWAEVNLAALDGHTGAVVSAEPLFLSTSDDRVRAEYQQLRAELEMSAGQWEAAVRRLDALLRTELAAHGSDPVWAAQTRLATRRAVESLIALGRYEEALKRWQPDASPPASPGTCLTAVALGSRVAVWMWTSNALRFRWASLSTDAYQRLARLLTTLSSRAGSSEGSISRTAETLGTALFGNWLSELVPAGPVYFQPDPELVEFPLALLPGRGAPLGVIHPLAVGPPAESPVDFASGVAVDATAAGAAGGALPPLPSASEEMNAVRAVVTRSVELRGRDATATQVIAALSGSSLLHFAGHAIPRSEGAALLLAGNDSRPDGLLEVADLPDGVPGLVVLSACSTGRRFQEENDTGSPITLPAAFLGRGARQVVASYWDVESGGSAAFMGQFYEVLGRSRHVGVALQESARALRTNPRYRHPYYWAVYGRWITTRRT